MTMSEMMFMVHLSTHHLSLTTSLRVKNRNCYIMYILVLSFFALWMCLNLNKILDFYKSKEKSGFIKAEGKFSYFYDQLLIFSISRIILAKSLQLFTLVFLLFNLGCKKESVHRVFLGFELKTWKFSSPKNICVKFGTINLSQHILGQRRKKTCKNKNSEKFAKVGFRGNKFPFTF